MYFRLQLTGGKAKDIVLDNFDPNPKRRVNKDYERIYSTLRLAK